MASTHIPAGVSQPMTWQELHAMYPDDDRFNPECSAFWDNYRGPTGLIDDDEVPSDLINRARYLNERTLMSRVYRDAEALAKERDCDTMDLDPIRDGFLSRVAEAVFTAYNLHYASAQAWSALETAREMLGQEFDSSLVFSAHRYRYEVRF